MQAILGASPDRSKLPQKDAYRSEQVGRGSGPGHYAKHGDAAPSDGYRRGS